MIIFYLKNYFHWAHIFTITFLKEKKITYDVSVGKILIKAIDNQGVHFEMYN